jgi:hypothetical protein
MTLRINRNTKQKYTFLNFWLYKFLYKLIKQLIIPTRLSLVFIENDYNGLKQVLLRPMLAIRRVSDDIVSFISYEEA